MPGFEFEAEVLRVARAKWPQAAFSGAVMFDGRERDGLFQTEDAVHVFECTELATKEKAAKDCAKISQMVRMLRPQHPLKVVKGWFITAKEPLALQRAEALRFQNDLVCCSFEQFSQTLVNSREYLSLRLAYKFGSAANPEDDSLDIKDHPFVEIDLLEVDGSERNTFEHFAQEIEQEASRVLIRGDFGAGKSMTLREIFLRLRKRFIKGQASRFPIHLNLRDHQGETLTVEAVERHARYLGFPVPADLVKAWRGGFADLILDGFDEIASSGWTALNNKLREIRFANMALVRNFVKETPSSASIINAGRPTYFDSDRELENSLGTRGFRQVRIGEFTSEQAATFIAKRRLSGLVPDWLPARPLLLGYLLSKKTLNEGQLQSQSSEAEGWDYLLERICVREAQVDQSVQGSLIRLIVERLATLARARGNGLGPFTRDDLSKAFKEICGFSPQLGSDVILLRLPGIGNHSEDDGTRSFIDEDLADVARAGDVSRFIIDPFSNSSLELVFAQSSIGRLGAQVSAVQLLRNGIAKGGILRTAIDKANELGGSESSSLPVDILLIAQASNLPLDGRPVLINSADCEHLEFFEGDPSFSNVTFRDCVISYLVLDEQLDASRIPTFKDCFIGTLEGRTANTDLPVGRFENCSIDEYTASVGTLTSIMQADLSIGTRVLLSIIKKLFLQAGKGRQESALFRGLDHRVRDIVPGVLKLVEAEGFATEMKFGGKSVWTPVRKYSGRARAMLASPHSSSDPLLVKSKRL